MRTNVMWCLLVEGTHSRCQWKSNRGQQEINLFYKDRGGGGEEELEVWREGAQGDCQGRWRLILTDVWAVDLTILYSLLAWSTRWPENMSRLHNTPALTQSTFLMSIFHDMEMRHSSCLERHDGSTPPGDRFSLYVVGCCVEQSGCSAFKLLAHVIRGLWFGRGPECHDVYFKQVAVDFHCFISSIAFSWRWTRSHFASYPALHSRSLLFRRGRCQPSVYTLSKALLAK